MKFAPYDELNVLRTRVEFLAKEQAMSRKEKTDSIEDFLLDILTYAYLYGNADANEMLGTEIFPSGEELTDTVYKDIAGENVKDRIQKWVDPDGKVGVEQLMRLAESEITRDYNSGIMDTGKASGLKLKKTWQTMMDERVRDTHDFLEGVTVPFDEKFFTYDGDSAMGPGGFENPENNVNCRCGLMLSPL